MSINEIPSEKRYGMMPPWTGNPENTEDSCYWCLGCNKWHNRRDMLEDQLLYYSRPIDCGDGWELVPAKESPVGIMEATRNGVSWFPYHFEGVKIASGFVAYCDIIAIRRPVAAKKKVRERCGDNSGGLPKYAVIPCPQMSVLKQESAVEQTSREAQLMADALQFGPKPKQTNEHEQAMEKAWNNTTWVMVSGIKIAVMDKEQFVEIWNAAQSAKEDK